MIIFISYCKRSTSTLQRAVRVRHFSHHSYLFVFHSIIYLAPFSVSGFSNPGLNDKECDLCSENVRHFPRSRCVS